MTFIGCGDIINIGASDRPVGRKGRYMIAKFSVKKPYTVLVGVVLAIVLGVVSFMNMTADLLPSMTLPYVVVMTTYVGASPETVETVVTQPIEASMATVSNIESINSVSGENYSMVILEFSQTANMDSVSLEIRESLDQIESYWTDDLIGSPIIMKLNPDMLPVMVAAVGVANMDVAEVSAYAQEFVMPELESIEGVASVSATGLIEESLNVIIRQEKVDEINQKIMAAIDKQMEEAEQELADGKTEIEDGLTQIEDGLKELHDGQKELDDGKSELADGKKELEEEQEKVLEELASAKAQLLTAKADLETMKTTVNVDVTTLRAMLGGLIQLEEGVDKLAQAAGGMDAQIMGMKMAYAQAQASVSGNDAAFATAVEVMKQQTLAALPDENIKNALSQLNWVTQFGADVTSANTTTVCGIFYGYRDTLNGQLATLNTQRDTLQDNISIQFLHKTIDRSDAITEAERDAISEQLKKDANKAIETLLVQYSTFEQQIEQLDEKLVELYEGESAALLGFADGKNQITMGETQMEEAQAQLDSAKEELESAREELRDAMEQIAEGKEQLEEARGEAYDQADMTKVLTVETISGLLVAQNFSMPAGYVTEEGVSYMVRVGDKPGTAEEMAELPLLNMNMDGVDIIRLSDVADVFYTDNSDEVYANVNGSPGVILTVQKQTGYSTGAVSDLLLARFDEMMESNPDLSMIALMDQGIYIDLVMDSILSNILSGGLLAILILILFLKDLRPTFVVAVSIPISLVTAIVCMYFSGVTLNVISLSGLALGIGMLVDNSIVVIENIYRLRNEGMSMREAAIEGAKEVGGAIMASTLTTICVFLPIVFMKGVTRQLFVDMGLTIAYSLLASLFIALTVVPAMASKTLRKTKEKSEGRFFRGLTNVYDKILRFSLKFKPLVLILVVVLLVISALAAVSNGTAFMSDMDSTQLTVTVQTDEETSLTETGKVTDQVVALIRELDEIQDVGAMASSSSASLMGGGSSAQNVTTIYVTTIEEKTMTNEEIADIILERTAALPAEISVQTASMDMSAMGGSGITINVEGRDLDSLQRIAKEVADIVAGVEGTTAVLDGMEENGEELRITIDREKAIRYGLTVAQVFQQVSERLAESGSATTLVADDKDYGVYVISEADEALTREDLKSLPIEGTDEDQKTVEIPFEQIANFEMVETMSSINRADQTRYVSVSAAIADGYNVGLVGTAIKEALEDYELPAGYRLEFAGENETINEAMGQVGLMLLLALIFMYLIMVAQFQSLLSPFIIMFTIPLAFTGGFLALFMTGSEVSVIAMLGFVMLSGIIVNNGIVLIDFMNQLREGGMSKKDAIIEAGRTRLRPVLMTALTTILGLSTMVFSNDMGSEMMKPMSIVTIGGLTYGTLLTLIVIPCIYDIFSRERKDEE